MMHDAHTTYDGSTPAHANSASMFNHNEPSFFEESFQYDGTPVDSDAGTYQQWSDLQYHNLNNFRPTSSTGTSFNSSFSSMNSSHTTDVDDTAIHKIDNSPVMPALSYHVDTSKYEHVDYEDYVMRSIDYEGSSPSSNETESTGPPTPTSPGVGSTPFRTFYNDAFLAPRRDSFATKIESAPLQCRPDVLLNNYASLTAQPSHVPLSVIFNEAQNPSNAYMTFANHPHAHGPPVQSALPYQGLPPTTLSQRATLESSNLSTTGAEPKLEQPFLDTTFEEDSDTDSDHGMELEASDRAVDEAHHRRDRDRYLLKMREKGLSYKEIKRRGRFTEAESTLRGRVRVMTKHKSERVRKPVWTENDVSHRMTTVAFHRADQSSRSNCSKRRLRSSSTVLQQKTITVGFHGRRSVIG